MQPTFERPGPTTSLPSGQIKARSINNSPTSPILASKDADELRAQPVWQLVLVMWATWNFFVCFFWVRGNGTAATICVTISLLQLVMLIACYRVKNYRLILNLILSTAAVGLFLVSICDSSLSMAILFFPISLVVSSQLFGVRAAFPWFLVDVFAIFLHYLIAPTGSLSFEGMQWNEMTLVIGVTTCTFFCCWQGEQFYRERTRDLFEFGEGLRRKSERLQHLATTDSLTGLVNRFQFHEILKSQVSVAVTQDESVALFLVDMDGFKELNDVLGHPVGDSALVEIAKRLHKEFGGTAEIARLGGDEFCVIIPNIDQEEAHSVARRIEAVLAARFDLNDSQVALGASIGYAFCPKDAVCDSDLLAYADTAMYQAKEQKLGYLQYESSMTKELIENREMQERLSTALEKNEFFLVYQPQVNLWTGEVFGVEALLRWRCDGEVIPPYRFISNLEKSLEIIPVSKWIIRECCRQLAQWHASGYDISVSINVSPVQFRDEDFHESILRPIREYGIDASKLDFEITESLLVTDVDDATKKLQRVKTTGASVSIDDFGTGYSSLAYLRHFPIDRLKIDRAFIKDIPDSDDGTIALSIVVLAKALGLDVLAEGVETEEHVAFLKEHDCDSYQGYLFSRPVSPEEVVEHFRHGGDSNKLEQTEELAKPDSLP